MKRQHNYIMLHINILAQDNESVNSDHLIVCYWDWAFIHTENRELSINYKQPLFNNNPHCQS